MLHRESAQRFNPGQRILELFLINSTRRLLRHNKHDQAVAVRRRIRLIRRRPPERDYPRLRLLLLLRLLRRQLLRKQVVFLAAAVPWKPRRVVGILFIPCRPLDHLDHPVEK